MNIITLCNKILANESIFNIYQIRIVIFIFIYNILFVCFITVSLSVKYSDSFKLIFLSFFLKFPLIYTTAETHSFQIKTFLIRFSCV
jgi:hypothetical protein